MDILWAPWRMQYIVQAREGDTGCFICTALAADRDRDNLVVRRTTQSVVILNKFPYNNGHLLVAPRAHKADPSELDDAETLDLMRTLTDMLELLRAKLTPDGFNIGVNLGRVAGAGLPGHLHWHVVPRWQGDTNFMPVVADTKVISQSLFALYDLLTQSDQATPEREANRNSNT